MEELRKQVLEASLKKNMMDSLEKVGTIKYAVLLAEWTELPHVEFGKDVARILGMHTQDGMGIIRRQQGIVIRGLEKEAAEELGSYLINQGHPCGLVEDTDICQIGDLDQSRNADPVPEGYELEDMFGNKTLIKKEDIVLAQAGWVSEEIELGSSRLSTPRYGDDGSRLSSFNYSREADTRELGSVLQLFHGGEPYECVRIEGSNFNYDYQDMSDGETGFRFAIMLNDLAKVLDYDTLDEGFRLGMGARHARSPEAEYDTLDDMLDRARWWLTMRKVL